MIIKKERPVKTVYIKLSRPHKRIAIEMLMSPAIFREALIESAPRSFYV